jgi:hypothetical protein
MELPAEADQQVGGSVEAHASGARSITDTLNDPLDVVEEMLEGSC